MSVGLVAAHVCKGVNGSFEFEDVAQHGVPTASEGGGRGDRKAGGWDGGGGESGQVWLTW